ncbi:MAG: hypothetical protein COA52_01660 [Hyphomicrobiales bacterium]|nr:hypothetical protein [Hyphomicrobiales bacterium]PCJ96423.1 MAG: hypothetical protein COA52_01660 [Hyphomicrobiales bacterium]
MSIAISPIVEPFSDIIDRIAPKRFSRDPFGIVSSYRAYLVFMHFDGMSDQELAAAGLARRDIPQLAASLILNAHKAKAA